MKQQTIPSTDGRNARAEETRQKILVAARFLIDRFNRPPTIESIANRAKITTRTIYYHFQSVEEVIQHALAISPRRTLVTTIQPAKKP